ncbi:unnamed protein product [Moneuplotes crassus]|uniref:Uncharacterized protein n=1 Tax=Euplotes crassus TaxID=5936 RepID=A0AAD1XKI8_EUPCR|nr:unnamed protein product [Moneuplotes crassus]
MVPIIFKLFINLETLSSLFLPFCAHPYTLWILCVKVGSSKFTNVAASREWLTYCSQTISLSKVACCSRSSSILGSTSCN